MLTWAVVPKVCRRAGVWAHRLLSRCLPPLDPLATLLNWTSHYGKWFATQNSAKDSGHLLASSWLVSWLLIFIPVIFCLLKNISAAQHCLSLLFSYATFSFVCLPYIFLIFLLLAFIFLFFIINHTFLCLIIFISLFSSFISIGFT